MSEKEAKLIRQEATEDDVENPQSRNSNFPAPGSRGRLTALLTQLPVPIAYFEGGELLCSAANNHFSTIFGKSTEELTGLSLLSIFEGLDETHKQTINEALVQGSSLLIPELPVLNSGNDSREVIVRLAMEPATGATSESPAIVINLTDITNEVLNRRKLEAMQKLNEEEIQHRVEDRTAELRRSLEELKLSEERYHKMISEVEDYAIIFLDDNGNIVNWNIGAEKIKGYTAEEIIGKNFSIFYPTEDRARNFPETLLTEARFNGKALHEGWRVRKDGSKFWGSIVITAVHNADVGVIGFSKVTRDLTERKNAEDKMREYLVELESQNQELEQFAYIASHDLQEPLRKIQTFADVINSNLHNEQMVSRYLGKLDASAKRMTELIKSVLNYSRVSRNAEAMIHTDLNEVLHQVTADYELLLHEKSGTIESENLPVIRAIPPQMHQLFANIIGNALKYNTRAPLLQITSRLVSRDGVIHKPLILADGNYIEIKFADNGIGFDEKYESTIFAMFQRLHGRQEYSGTGIGLALCKKIMETHSGHITATSQPGEGSNFYVYFPVHG